MGQLNIQWDYISVLVAFQQFSMVEQFHVQWDDTRCSMGQTNSLFELHIRIGYNHLRHHSFEDGGWGGVQLSESNTIRPCTFQKSFSLMKTEGVKI